MGGRCLHFLETKYPHLVRQTSRKCCQGPLSGIHCVHTRISSNKAAIFPQIRTLFLLKISAKKRDGYWREDSKSSCRGCLLSFPLNGLLFYFG